MNRSADDAPSAIIHGLGDVKVDLPPLPSSLRYWDDFGDIWRTISNPESNAWRFLSDGEKRILQFQYFPESVRFLAKHWIVYIINRNSCATVYNYCSMVIADRCNLFVRALHLASLDRLEVRERWFADFLLSGASKQLLTAIKSFIRFLCHISFGKLSLEESDFISGLPLPKIDKFASVREGDVFLSLQDDQRIITYLDKINSETIGNPASVPTNDLMAACILCIAYQYAMRPIQIAKVCLDDVTIYVLTNGVAVHVRFFRAKQRKGAAKYAMVRKIKREWSYIFQEYMGRRNNEIGSITPEILRRDAFFALTPADVSKLIMKTLADLGIEHHNATDLRHTAAQRMVDAGASHVELAEYMGHAWADTSPVYYDISATQAERINQALALSPVYSVLTEVALNKTIELESLSTWPPDKQVAAVPHGIPISGIGACELGQHLCNKNPVTSCYGCENFLPISDVTKHQEVLDSLRPIVIDFYQSSRGEGYSPAYMQLRGTLESVANIIDQLEGSQDEQGEF